MTGQSQVKYTESFEQASEALRRVLPLMTRHRIPPHPQNFAVWYEYATGCNALLVETIDDLVEDGASFTDAVNQDLYIRFFARNEPYLERARDMLRRIVADLREQATLAGGDMSRYCKTLERYEEALETARDLDQINRMTNEVLGETRTTERSAGQLDNRLLEVVQDVELLRKELEQVREEVLSDGLTGIGNRKAFDAALERAVKAATETRAPFSLLMVDIDHFKAFNDSFGHLIGDRVLRFVAHCLRNCVKGNDRPSRFGGEEFTVILPRTFLAGGVAVAEQIRQEIALGDLRDKRSGANFGRVTVSIGVAQYRPGETGEDVLKRVDQALYRAKKRGRNRVMKAD